MRGSTLTVEAKLIVETCYQCGTPFAIADDLRARLLADKSTFYCPIGHPMNYVGESDKAKIKRLAAEAAAARESEQYAWKRHDEEAKQRKELQRQARAADRRARAALCPVDGCHRQVQQLKRHMQSKHPDYVDVGS